MLQATRVIAPTGSLRQQFVLSRVAAEIEDGRSVLLINLNPLREVFASPVLAMGGLVLTPSGAVSNHGAVGSTVLRYVTVAEEGTRIGADPGATLEGLIQLAPRHTTDGELLVVDGCQALAAQARPTLRALCDAALARGCNVVAIGSMSSDTECLADLAGVPVKLPSKYDMNATHVSADWLLGSRSWGPGVTL